MKFISIDEFVKLLQVGLAKNNLVIDRADFNGICIKSNRSGPGGFCVMIRLMEMLNIGKYLGTGKNIQIADIKRSTKLMK